MVIDSEEREARLRHQATMSRLLAIPGVRSVGLGFKQTSRRLQPYWAYRVYVDQKRALRDLPSSQRVPAMLGGFYTDVLVGGGERVRPESGRPAVAPGSMIARYLPGEPVNHGTLGLVVRMDGQRFLLTNEHILRAPGLDNRGYREIFSPDRKTCLDIQCNKPVAQIGTRSGDLGDEETDVGLRSGIEIDGEPHFVDCGLARLHDGAASNHVPALGGALEELRRLTTVPRDGLRPVDPIIVRKSGAGSAVTRGRVTQLQTTRRLRDGTEMAVWEMLIEPTDHPGPEETFEYDQRFELPDDTQLADIETRFRDTPIRAEIDRSGTRPTVRFHGRLFSISRDSGAAVVDESRRVVGLHHGSLVHEYDVIERGRRVVKEVPLGRAVACHIHSVFFALGLDPASALVLSGSPTGGEVVDDAEVAPCPEPPMLDELAQAMQQVPLGSELMALARDHLQDVADLIHTRRRVMVTWHRWRGPAFVAAFVRASGRRHAPIPRSVDGVALEDALRRMRDVLLVEGSEPLRRAIRDRGDVILELATRADTIDGLLEALRRFDRVEDPRPSP